MKKLNIKVMWIFIGIFCAFITGAVSCEDADKLPDETADTSDDTVQTTETVLDEPAIDELDYTIDGISYTIDYLENSKNNFRYGTIDIVNRPVSEKGFLLQNGYVVISHWCMSVQGKNYYLYYIIGMDGNSPDIIKNEEIHQLSVTDNGNIIITYDSGDTEVYDSQLNLIELPDTNFYYAFSLDNGRYFAVNDEFSSAYMGLPSFAILPPERFALYRYTEKLTESEFAEIRAVDGGFECVYPEDSEKSGESLFYPVDDMVPFDEQYFTLVYDEESEQYYYLDVAGNKLFDMNFDFACGPTNNSAVVRVDKDYYVIQAIAQD